MGGYFFLEISPFVAFQMRLEVGLPCDLWRWLWQGESAGGLVGSQDDFFNLCSPFFPFNPFQTEDLVLVVCFAIFYLLYTLSACCFKEIHRSWLVQEKGRVRYRVVLQFPQAGLNGEFIGATFSLLQYVAVVTGCPTPDIRMLWCIYEDFGEGTLEVNPDVLVRFSS